jgi:hypothetical protein
MNIRPACSAETLRHQRGALQLLRIERIEKVDRGRFRLRQMTADVAGQLVKRTCIISRCIHSSGARADACKSRRHLLDHYRPRARDAGHRHALLARTAARAGDPPRVDSSGFAPTSADRTRWLRSACASSRDTFLVRRLTAEAPICSAILDRIRPGRIVRIGEGGDHGRQFACV